MYSVLAWSFPQLANYKKLDKQYRGAVKKHSGTVARLEAHGLKLEEQDAFVQEDAKGSTRLEELKKIRDYKMA